MAAATRAEPGQTQELQLGLPYELQGPKNWSYLTLLFPGHWQESGLEVGQSIWDAGVTGNASFFILLCHWFTFKYA